MTPPARDAVIKATREVPEKAEQPIESKVILTMLRTNVRLGPSDRDQFFYATMNEEKPEFVYLLDAG